jgi:UrcA family protein
MHARTGSITALCLAAAAIIAIGIPITLFPSDALAGDHEVTVAIRVPTQGLDLSQSDGAQKFYIRLKNAADDACTSGDRFDLAPPENPKRCYEQALAGAVRSANVALVTQIYLETHTVREASAYGVSAPAQVAAK